MAPAGGDIVEHLLFALKHEGTNLQVIAEAGPHLAPPRLDPRVYIYWDATPCVEFTLRMARQALEQDLAREAEFLAG